MSIFDSIILGIVQGLTEFIPVSSSGHLIIIRDVLGINLPNTLAFDAILHLATALAILVYFREEIWNILNEITASRNESEGHGRLLWPIILGTIPAVLAGFFFEAFINESLRNTKVVMAALVFGSLIFLFAEKIYEKFADHFLKREVSLKDGIIIGLYQALALIPGISRSGITIAGGFMNGLSREKAIRFAFLLGFPVIAGSGLKKLYDLAQIGFTEDFGFNIVIGSIIAFSSGLWAIKWLLRYLSSNKLTVFAWYRIALALLVLIFI